MSLIIVLLVLVTTLLSAIISLALLLRQKIRVKLGQQRRKSIGFFHPHPLAGGGGERVLWIAVLAASKRIPNCDIIIYGHFGTGNGSGNSNRNTQNMDIATIKGRIRDQFGIQLDSVSFTPVNVASSDVDFIRAAKYPRFTLLLQAAGSIYLGTIVYISRPVDIVIETGNFTFALILPFLLGAKTIAYVHYPIVSANMLAFVRSGSSAFNNDALIARSKLLTSIKAIYYHGFAFLYGVAARCIHVPVANSSWTRRHLEAVWRLRNLHVVFPPCDINTTEDEQEKDTNLVLSVGQFRPEKRHMLQLDAFEQLEKLDPGHKLRLIMVGGARGPSDAARAASLMKEAKRRKVAVEVRVNVPHEELDGLLRKASIGLHTMKDEHFGISVVNMQANGLIAVAHGSGGVAADIISDEVSGFLVGTAIDNGDAFARCLLKAAKMGRTEKGATMRRRSRKEANRFSNDAFQADFGRLISHVWEEVDGRNGEPRR